MTATEAIKKQRQHMGVDRFQQAICTWTNQPNCEADDDGDVWDGRGYWWDDGRKNDFLNWLDTIPVNRFDSQGG